MPAPSARDEALPAQAARGPGAAAAAQRAPRPRCGGEAAARLGAGRLRQDDACSPSGWRRRPGGSGGLGVARRGRQRPGVLLDLRGRRAAHGGAGGRRERARAAGHAPAAADPAAAHDAAQRPRCDRRRHRAGARRLPRHRVPRGPRGDGVPARPPASAAAPGDRQPGRSARCRWPGCARAASWSRSARPICASRPRRRRRTSTGRWACSSPPATWPRWRSAPRAGSPRSSWPRSRCRDATTWPASSPGSPATTATSSTTWWRRSCSASPRPSATSCCTPRSSTGSAARCATPSPAREGGKAMLEALDRGNLFVVPLDDRRQWYRYHHLFADVLRARLAEESPELVPALHRRASDWYAEHGDTVRGDRARAGRRALRARGRPGGAGACPSCAGTGRRPRCVAGSSGCPRRSWQVRPVLSNGYAGALLAHRRVEGVERHLRNAERWLEDPSTSAPDADGRRGRRGVPPAARPGSPSTGPGWRWRRVTPRPRWPTPNGRWTSSTRTTTSGAAAATALIGLASWAGGDLEAAPRRLRDSAWPACGARATSPTSSGCPSPWRTSRSPRAACARRCAPTSRRCGSTPRTGGPVAARHGRHVRRDERRPPRAQRPAEPPGSSWCGARSWASTTGCRRTRYRWRVAMARLREAEGDLGEAVDLLDEAERVYVGDFSPNVRPVPAVRARVWIRAGASRRRPRLGPRPRACPPTTSSATCASTST